MKRTPIRTAADYDALLYLIDAITEFCETNPDDCIKEIESLHTLIEIAYNYELSIQTTPLSEEFLITAVQAAGLLQLLPIDILELYDLGMIDGKMDDDHLYVYEKSVLHFKERHDSKKQLALKSLVYKDLPKS